MLLSGLFAFYLSLYFLRLHEYRPETAQTNILFVTLALCLITYLFKKEKNLKTVQIPFLVGFIIVAILSHVKQFYLQGAINTADELLRLAALFFISSSIFVDRKRLEFYFKLMVICAFIIALHGIYQFHGNGVGWTGETMYQGIRVRYIGVFHDPNDMGMLLLIAIPLLLYLFKNSKSILVKSSWLSMLAAILYGIYLTGSRGTLLGLLAIIFAYIWLKLSRTIAIVTSLVAVPLAFAVTQLSTISSDDASSAGRIDAWGEGIQMLKSNPFLGVGHGMFTDYHIRAAHSSYVETFAETGLIGYFFWLGFVSMSLYGLYRFSFNYSLAGMVTENQQVQIVKDKAISTTLVFSLMAYMVTAFFISRSMQPLLFILCAMSAGLFYQFKKSYPDYEQLRFRNTFTLCAFLTLVSVLFVYIVIRMFW